MIGCLRIEAPEDAALRALRLRLDQLSPRVEVRGLPRPVLLADLGRGRLAEARLHGQALRAAAVANGLAAAVGVAPTATLAALAARRALPAVPLVIGPAAVPALLDTCPVSWLEPLAPHAAALHGLGLRSLGAVARLPAAAIGARFGGNALRAWRALHGDELPLIPLPAPPRLRLRRVFGGPVADQAVLIAALGRMAARLASALERRGAQARALALHLHSDVGVIAAGRVLERPASRADALAPIAAGLLVAAGLQAGVKRLDLLVGELVPLRGEQLTLFTAPAAAIDLRRAALADLAARLGPGQLLHPGLSIDGVALSEERGQLTGWVAP